MPDKPVKLAQARCPQVHRRDTSRTPRACGPCGQRAPRAPDDLTPKTVALPWNTHWYRVDHLDLRTGESQSFLRTRSRSSYLCSSFRVINCGNSARRKKMPAADQIAEHPREI